MRVKLMIPGPIELEEEVLEWMGSPTRAHYGDEWVRVHNETIALLRGILGTKGKVFIMPGSGMLGNDAVIHNLFSPGEQVILGINGFFGQRLQETLIANGIHIIPVEGSASKPLDPAEFDRVLAENPSAAGVAVVHLETSTAILNPVKEIAAITHRHNRLLMVDAVSSLGGTEFCMDEWHIDACVSASQKGLGGAPGLAVVALSERAWEVIVQKKDSIRSWYLDLKRWQRYAENWADWHPFPVTMPTAVVLGLRAALQSIHQQGLAARLEHYRKLARRLRDGLEKLGFSLFVPEAFMTPVLTAMVCPPGIAPQDLISRLEQEHQIKITGGLGEFRGSVIRIGHMGGAVSEKDIDALLAAIEACSEAVK